MQKITSFVLLVFFLTINLSLANNQDRKWSRIIKSNEKVTQKQEIKIPISTETRKINLQNGVASVSPNVPVHPTNGATQSELSIITHPTNPNIIIGGSNAAEISSINWLSQGWYISTNGGNNWYGSDTLPPHLVNFDRYTSDPAVGIDLDGNMYFNTLFYGLGTGDVVTTKSTNNGGSWSPFATVPSTTTGKDKNHFVIDVVPNSPYEGYMYTTYTEFDISPTRIYMSRSTDGGATFLTPISISQGNDLDQGVNTQIGPNGEVYGTWTSYDPYPSNSNAGFVKSIDGGATWSNQISAATNIADIRGQLVKGGNSIRCSSFPSMAVDRTGGLRNGYIYIAYAAKPNGNPDIFLVRSVDGGTNWSEPIKVNQDNSNKDQWQNWITIDQSTGAVYIVYFDSRNFPANDSAQVYLSRSLDGGETFEDVLISDHAFLPASIQGLAGGYMGDYIGVTANSGIVYPFWNDNRTGHHQAYFSKAIFGPTIEHTPLTNTEDMNGPYTVNADITSSGVPLNESSVKLFWTDGSVFLDSSQMVRGEDGSFIASFYGDGTPHDYRYYIQASDSLGGTSRHPASAPLDYNMFSVATDTIAPIIFHSGLEDQFIETWPQTIKAEASDNIGIDSVWCEWSVNEHSGYFLFEIIEDGNYIGTFNTEGVTLNVGDEFHYTIFARDLGSNHIVAQFPESGHLSFLFKADTIFPTIAHNALRNQPKLRWPATVKTTIEDELGISSAIVEWYKNDESNSSTFELGEMDPNMYSGMFNSDTNSIQVGDSIFYRIKATDGSNNTNISYFPDEGYLKFYIIATKGLVMVVDDDELGGSFARKYTKPNNIRNVDTISSEGSADLFVRTLTEVGYIVDKQTVPDIDTTVWDDYDILVWSHGKSSGPANEESWRRAMSSRVQRGMSVIVEGGDIGWQFMSSSSDEDFATNVLHCDDFVSESNELGNAVLSIPTHPIATVPNALPNEFALENTTVYDRDANDYADDASAVYTWSSNNATSAIVAWDDTPNPLRGRVVYISLNVNNIVKSDSIFAKALIENSAEWLVGSEPPPTGSLSGAVTLQGAPNNGGVNVRIKGITIDETIVTGESGEYLFENLYAGNYKVYAWKEMYYPLIDSLMVQVNDGIVTGVNFNLSPMLYSIVKGTVALSDSANPHGVEIKILNQVLSTTTNENGKYRFENVLPTNVNMLFKKHGYRPYSVSFVLGNGDSIVVDANLIASIGSILIVDDDENTNTRRKPKEKNSTPSIEEIDPNGSAYLFGRTLTDLGYVVDEQMMPNVDTTTWVNYDIIVWSHGRSSSPANIEYVRRAMSNRVQNGGKLLVEGGDIGWQYMSSTPDWDFANNALHCVDFVSEGSTLGNPIMINASHPIVSMPNALPEYFPLVSSAGVYDRDANLPDENSSAVYSWEGDNNSSSLVVWEASNNPLDARTVYISFNINNIAAEESLYVKALIENSVNWLLTGGMVSVNENQSVKVPTTFALHQNYPNPFNPKTKIKYEIAKNGFVNLKVFDVLGREIKTLVNENKNVGVYEIEFDANNLNSGIYFYKLTTNNFSEMKKMILVK